MNDVQVIDVTPNEIIKNPNTRWWLGAILHFVALTAAIGTLALIFFPEISSDLAIRIIASVNAVIMLIGSFIGIGVTLPNIPIKRR